MLVLSISPSTVPAMPDKTTIKARFKEQSGACFYCGFEAQLAMRPCYERSSKQWVLACPLCFDVLHLDEAAVNRPHGKIIEDNVLSQVQLNFVVHTIWATQHFNPDGFSQTSAATIWNALNQLTYGIEYNFSKGASKLPVIASVLESLPTKQYERRHETLRYARYLPSDLDYKPQIAYWAENSYEQFKDDLPSLKEVSA